MRYHDPIRRRLRSAGRVVAAAARPNMWRTGRVVAGFWWDGHPNFGDAMTPWLLPHYGLLPIHRSPAQARVTGAGSILEFVPADFDGAIWGSGLIRGEAHPLPVAKPLAVRGPLTRDLIGAPADTALGDPGILASRVLSAPATRWDVGLVPHGHHRSHADFLALADTSDLSVRVIDVHTRAPTAVREIASCACIVTTSLHGLVTADSYGIPVVWTTLEPVLEGGDFKFRDYESALTPGSTRRVAFGSGTELADLMRGARVAPPDAVEEMSDGLEAALGRLPAVLEGLPRLPGGVAEILFRRS